MLKISEPKDKIMKKLLNSLFVVTAFLLLTSNLNAQEIKKVVIQVSTDDARTQKIAINNAVNLQNHYGIDNVKVEVVAYGPGLSLLTKKNKQSDRIESLAMGDIKFSACGNTMKKAEKKKGKKPVLSNGVKIVPAGVGRIVDLQTQGYTYIRP